MEGRGEERPGSPPSSPRRSVKRGSAVDVVCVRRADGRLACTEWAIRFERSWSKRAYEQVASGLSRLRASYGASQRRRRALRERTTDFSDDEANESDEAEAEASEARVAALAVNGVYVVGASLRVERDGSCFFGGGDRPSAEELERFGLEAGRNEFRVEVRRGQRTEVAAARCFLWDSNDPVVVCDIDGTVTRTDVRGFVDSVVADQPSVAHANVCAFFETLAAERANVLYLTARPISLADFTRSYLAALEQLDRHMPTGPVVTSRETVASALYTELVTKTPDLFKTRALLDLVAVYGRLPLLAGFGNRLSDCRAYARAGIRADAIFMIDPDSRLTLPFAPGDGADPTFDGYADPRLSTTLAALLRRAQKRPPLPRPILRPPAAARSASA